MTRVIAYVRVSTNKQDLKNQRFEIERYCSLNNITVDEWDSDIASGTVKVKDRRAGALLDKLQSGDTLIVSEVSRISRSIRTIFDVVQDLIERGVAVISVKEGVKFGSDLTSTVMLAGLGLAAEIERKMISARTREALARKKSEGMKLGRPLGTHRPEHRKLHGKDEEILRYMRRRVSKAAIARLLDVNVGTLRTYIKNQELDTRLLLEQLKQTGV